MIKSAGLDVLSCGEGHLEIRFNNKDVLETEKAKRIVGDMLKRGYALFVHGTDDALIRVKRFDAKKGVYVIAEGPTVPTSALPKDKASKSDEREVPMAKSKATAIGRSAGG